MKSVFPRCSFCGEVPVTAWFEGPDFRRVVDAPEKVRADEAWLACPTCLRLVLDEDREALVRRAVERARRHGAGGPLDEALTAVARDGLDRFWQGRSSSATGG